MQWAANQIYLAIKHGGRFPASKRDHALERSNYERACETALDYYHPGEAQRLHLQEEMKYRLGEVRDPREPASVVDDIDGRDKESTAGRIIREGRLELVTIPLARAIIDSLAVLYAADDIERIYRTPDGTGTDRAAGRAIDEHHRRGGLVSKLHQVDALVVLLRTAHLLVRWCGDLGHIVYDVLPPHWVWALQNDSYPLEPRLAYAIAYAESTPIDGDAVGSGETIWCAYVRSPLPGDPPDAPTRSYPRGRLVRFQRNGDPWPLPEKGDASIVQDGDNPLIAAGGMSDGRRVWSPIVWHWAEPPMEELHLPPADDLVRANLEADISLSLLAYITNLQSAGQPVMTGSGELPDALGPSSVVKIDDPAGSFSFVSPGADLQGHAAVIQRQLQTQSMLRHLAPDTYSIQRPSIQTGPAKLLEQYALVEARHRRTLMADRWESDRFDIERVLHNAHAPGPSIPVNLRQIVHWGEMRVPVDRNAQVARIAQEVALGISDAVDAAMEVKGIDRGTAMARIAAIQQSSAKSAPAPEPPTGREASPESGSAE